MQGVLSYRAGWRGVWGEEGAKKIHLGGYGRFWPVLAGIRRMTGSTSGAGSFACTVKGGGGSGGRRGAKRSVSVAMGPVSQDL